MLHNQDILRHRKYFNKLASLPTTSDSLNEMSETLDQHQRNRKRRRGEVANPANTLDGLVAKRADDIGARDSLYKRYLTEAEAIEAPSDDQEMKRIEADPDVSTRTCSVCGYQGKWVSEMIRHKRVHTNERPFRCKYCSRTSKWKADLIRHVAKTHGIRVVSKYSRSKAFDNNPVTLNLVKNKTESDEKRKHCLKVFTDLNNDEKTPVECKKPKPLRLPIMYRCVICLFEQDSVLVLMSHLKNVHNALPYECRSCGSSFMDAQTTMKHFVEKTTCTRTDLKINIAPLYAAKNNFNSKQSFALLDEAAKRAAQELFSKSTVITSLTAPSAVSTATTVQKASPTASIRKCEVKQMEACSNPQNDPENQKDTSAMTYDCVFCEWNARELCAVEEHMRIHAENPSLLMQGMEFGLLKPVEIKANCNEIRKEGVATAAAGTEQILPAPLRCFDFGAMLSILKQQGAFNPLLSLQALASMTTPPHGWVPAGPSAFKQMSPASGEIPPVTSFAPYQVSNGNHQEKTIQQLSSLLIDTNNNTSCDPTTVISSFSPSARPGYFGFSNTVADGTSLDPGPANTNSSTSDVRQSSNVQSPEEIIKTSGHYYQRRNALCSAFSIAESKIQELGDSSKSSEGKIKVSNGVDGRKEDDDFVDVVQLDD